MNKLDLSMGMLVAALVVSFVAPASAQTINYTGSQLNLGADWRDTSVPKPYATANDIYGNDGYYYIGAIGASNPSYITNPGTPVQAYGGNGGYEQIDNPIATAPYFSGTATSGTAYVNGSDPSSTHTLLTFTLTGTVPSDIRVGVMFDNTDNSNGLGNNEYTLVETAGGTATSLGVTLATGNGVADYYFFDITGGSAGETFSLEDTNLSSTSNTNLQAGGLTFDTVPPVATPEPSTYAMLVMGLMVLAVLARRRSIRA